jgi:DNA-binding winged helix-turn-helix (wHTH) protein
MVVRFGVFEADLRTEELRRGGVRVRIQDLPFRALKLLLSRPNQVITREEFRQILWPADVFVDFDLGIRSAIKRLRDALGDSAENPIFVETVDRRGYRWIAPTRSEPSLEAALVAEPEQEDIATPVPASAGRWNFQLFSLAQHRLSGTRLDTHRVEHLLPTRPSAFRSALYRTGSQSRSAEVTSLPSLLRRVPKAG